MSAISTLEPTADEIRETGILLLAADTMICGDHKDAETAVAWSRRLTDGIDTNPLWKGGLHNGDCTKQPHTCSRCVVEEMQSRARRMWDE